MHRWEVFSYNLLVYLYFPPSSSCPSQETEVTSTPTRPVENVITMKGLQDRNIHILDGTTVENKVKQYILFICLFVYFC